MSMDAVALPKGFMACRCQYAGHGGDVGFAPDVLFLDAARVVVNTAHRLYGKHVANEERNDFAGRRILTG